jgi:hypothetical protein
MVGTITVGQGGGQTPGSGVDFTEYRVNTNGATGQWVRRDNTSAASPFVTSLNVSAVGSHVVECRSTDKAGNAEAINSVAFSIAASGGVSDSEDADVVADVPLMMALTLGGSATFSSLVPGVAKDYTASTAATATSSAPSTVLTVFDRRATATGRLVNGTAALPPALQASAGGPFAPIGGSAAPTLLKSWTGPFAGSQLTLEFKQPVTVTDSVLAATARR